MQQAEVGNVGGESAAVRIALAMRDESLTALGYCLEGGGLPTLPIRLVAGTHTLDQEGGVATEQGGYALFPSVSGQDVSVRLGDQEIARLRFARASAPRNCDLSSTEPFKVESCGAAISFEWLTEVDLPPARVVFVDAQATDCKTGEALGYMFRGVTHVGDKLGVRFATWAPDDGDAVCVTARAVRLSTEEGEREVILQPPLSEEIEVSQSS